MGRAGEGELSNFVQPQKQIWLNKMNLAHGNPKDSERSTRQTRLPFHLSSPPRRFQLQFPFSPQWRRHYGRCSAKSSCEKCRSNDLWSERLWSQVDYGVNDLYSQRLQSACTKRQAAKNTWILSLWNPGPVEVCKKTPTDVTQGQASTCLKVACAWEKAKVTLLIKVLQNSHAHTATLPPTAGDGLSSSHLTDSFDFSGIAPTTSRSNANWVNGAVFIYSK